MSIPNPHFAARDSPADLSLKKRAVVASLMVGSILVGLKLYAFLATDAVSILSSLLDSCFDILASITALAGIIHAATPADAQHRFGHGKAEALASFLQAIFITLSALFLLSEAAGRLRDPVALAAPALGIGVTVVAIILTTVLVFYQRRVIAQTQSVAVAADHLHYRGDLYMNLGVIAALALTVYTSATAIDAIFAIGIAFYLGWGALRIARISVDILMDRELPDAVRRDILAVIQRHPAAVGVHDLRTRATGERIFIEFHLELDGALRLVTAHTITEEIEKLLFDAYPASEVIIHQEPAGLDDHRLDDQVRG